MQLGSMVCPQVWLRHTERQLWAQRTLSLARSRHLGTGVGIAGAQHIDNMHCPRQVCHLHRQQGCHTSCVPVRNFERTRQWRMIEARLLNLVFQRLTSVIIIRFPKKKQSNLPQSHRKYEPVPETASSPIIFLNQSEPSWRRGPLNCDDFRS